MRENKLSIPGLGEVHKGGLAAWTIDLVACVIGFWQVPFPNVSPFTFNRGPSEPNGEEKTGLWATGTADVLFPGERFLNAGGRHLLAMRHLGLRTEAQTDLNKSLGKQWS